MNFQLKTRTRLRAAAFLLWLAGSASAQLPAFPGAEGYGSIATGGRGGDVYYVTNLNASGPGSLAEGVSTSPPEGRTILFAVSGHIRLSSTLTVRNNKITVAGQTAPGDGICTWNKPMNFIGNDLVIRNLRFRYGKQDGGGDAVNIGNFQQVIIDQCDVMFSTDENLSTFGMPPEFFTFQWSINAWGLSGHSAGSLWTVNRSSVHHTLWANNHTRNPKCINPLVFDWANNVSFGWDYGFNMAAGSYPACRVNIRGSYFIHGGNTSSAVVGGGLNELGENIFQLHASDSALDGSANGILDVTRINYAFVSSSTYNQVSTAWAQTVDGDPANPANPVIGTPVTLSPRLTAYKKVISKVGAVRMEIGDRPLRDEITQLCVNRTVALQRGIIADPLQLNLSTGTAFASLKSDPAPADTDLDGMPDDWEEAVGYDKEVPNNNTVLTEVETAASFFPPGSPAGYTQLEEYLHFKAVPHGTVGKNTAASPSFIDIDLRKYTSGFTVLPAFTTSNIIGGTLTHSGSGNAIVRFTPTQNSSGRGGFHFTVTDVAGDTWTQQCCLLISTRPQPRPLSWIGDGATNNWDSVTPNFSSTLGPAAFADNDAVTINDSGSNTPTIKVTGALAPASLTVANSTKNFTLQGAGSLSSTGRFAKSGSGTLTISNSGPNSFTAATLEGGTLTLTTANALGSAPITFNAGTLSFSADQANALIIGGSVAVNPSGSRTMNGAWSGAGTINLANTGSSMLTLGGSMANFAGDLSLGASTGSIRFYGNTGSAATAFDLGSSTATLFTRNGGSSFNLGALTGASGTTLSGASSTTTVTTYTVGALGSSTLFAGRITNGGQGATALTKTGAGTLTLTGNSTHSGATAINVGALALLGNFGTSPVTVAANATLTGSGTLGGSLATAAGAIISPGADNGASAGTLTAASLNLLSPALEFDLSSDPSAGNDRIVISNNGPVILSGPQNFHFNLIDGSLSPGTYNLITTEGTLTANGVTLLSDLPSGTRQILALQRNASGSAPGFVRLAVTGSNAALTWTGANGALWDQQTTAAWSGADPATFFNFDKVSFTDSASSGTVTITQPVAPHSITVSNTAARPYTITGAPITGTTSLVKSGTGSLTLNVSRVEKNDFAITNGSPIVTVGSTTGLYPGMTAVSPTNPALFPVGTTIVSVDSSTTVTLSQNATATSAAIKLIFESRNIYSGGTILNDGSLTLLSTSSQTYSSSFPPPANAFGLGTGPITLNGGTLNLYGHSLDTRLLGGPLPNDLIVPAGKSATLRSTRRGTYLNDLAGLSGSLTGSGTLNLIVNFSSAAITGDWSAFSGILNVSRPATAIDDPRFQLGNPLGLPLATVTLDQVTLSCTAAPPSGGVVIPIGSLSGTDTATIIAGAETGFAPVTWQVGGLNTSTTFAGNFAPYGNAPIGLAKTGSGTWTLTGTGTVSAGIMVENGTFSYGDSSTDTLGGTSEISIDPDATLQINSGAAITGSACEIFTGGTLRGKGTLNAPLTSSGTISVSGGTLAVTGNTQLSGSFEVSALTDRLAVTGNLDLAGTIQLPASGLSAGRKLLATYSGTLTPGPVVVTTASSAFIPVLDIATPGEVAVKLIDAAAYQAWQSTHFGNTGDPDGEPFADPDEDGMLNIEEYEAGTDPRSPASSLPLVWQGAASAVWDCALTANWLQEGTPHIFRNHRHVIINETGSSSSEIALSETLEPGSVTVVNSATPFTLSGAGLLTGGMPLDKGGAGTLVLATANSYTGVTTVTGGILNLRSSAALGSAVAGTLVREGARVELQDNITVAGEPLQIAGSGGPGFFYGALSSRSGANTWSGAVTIAGSGTRIGTQAGAVLALSGAIDSGEEPFGLIIRPYDVSAKVILAGACRYLGDTSLFGGMLQLAGGNNRLPVETTLKFGSSGISAVMDMNGCSQRLAGLSEISGNQNMITNSAASASVLTLSNATDCLFGGRCAGNLSLVKEGTGRLILNGANSFGGGVDLREGTLVLSGNAPFEFGGTLTNSATLDVRNWQGALPFGWVNNGTVLAPAPASVTINPSESTPGVVVGTNKTIVVTAHFSASVTNLPARFAWTQLSGPGSALFVTPAAPSSAVRFTAAGRYVLECTVTLGSDSGATGSATYTVDVLAPLEMTLRQGVDNYRHQATFIRSDNPQWNSGARNQMLVGRLSGSFRSLLSFDLAALPRQAVIDAVTLDLWTEAHDGGRGTIGSIELHALIGTLTEGTGDGISSSSGAGTGATWNSSDGVGLWTTPGGDYAPQALSFTPGFDATVLNTQRHFASTSNLVALVQQALSSAEPLSFLLRARTETVDQFVRFASDDAADPASRPLLRITYGEQVPTVTILQPVAASAALCNQSTLNLAAAVDANGLTGTLMPAWLKLSGPGAVYFENPLALQTTVRFSHPGRYVLQCSVTAGNGLRSGTATCEITVMHEERAELTLRQGANGYSHLGAMIRGDNPAWNAGARDQMLVGRTGSALRSVLSFELTALPQSAVIQSVTLDLWTAAQAGVGSVGAIELHEITAVMSEGSGLGTSAADSITGNGVTWLTSDGSSAWTPGGNFDSAILTTRNGYDATQTGQLKRFESTPAMVSALQAAHAQGRAFSVALLSPSTEAGSSQYYTRLASDDAADLSHRPLLRITFCEPHPASPFSARAVSATSVALNWSAPGGDAAGFLIERRQGTNGVWRTLAQVDTVVTELTDRHLAPGSFYGYRGKVIYGAGTSSVWTAEASVTLPESSGAAPLVILPLGDSITQGSTGANPATLAPGGYRDPLNAMLAAAGFEVKFVGSHTINPSVALTAASQAAHEGHGSYTTLNLLANLDGAPAGMPSASNGGHWLDGISGLRDPLYPDVILLMAGTNDLGLNQRSPAQALAGVGMLLDQLGEMRPDAHVIVATLVPYAGTVYPSRELNQQIYNAALPGVIAARRRTGQRVSLVDMRTRVTAAHLDNDGVHPSLTGYQAIAACWFDALRLLPLIENWRLEMFGSAAGSGDDADAADRDGDGDSNLMEYAMGSHPVSALSAAPLQIGFFDDGGDRYFGVRFVRRMDADVWISVEAAGSLSTPVLWSADTVPFGLPAAIDQEFEEVIIRDFIPAAEEPSRFIRIRALRP